jgi:predicted ATPase
LLLVDNFEHLISGADIVSKILQAAPNIQIIVTSRQRLNISSESVFAIGGLGLPDGNTVGNAALDSALELFVYSARRTNLDFALNEENLPDVIQISRLVQGMPLGIILAAAWIDILSPAEIASEIETDLDFLITEMADMPARHRSMRAVFDYSWRLLDEGEQRNVACFSVFRGGFTREAAQSVADISLRQLVGLVNKSLLQRDTASGRFEMHELLRQMAKEKLEEQSQLVPTQQQHADYFRELANKISLRLHGENMTTWMRQIDTDYENFQTAYEWLLINDIIGALQIVRSLWLYWFIRGRFTEGRTWAMRALEKADAVNQSKAYAEGAYVLASFAYFQHDLPTASYWSGISLRLSELHNDLFGIGVSSHHHGLISLTKGNIEKAEAYFSEALEKIQLLPNRWLEQVLITDLGHVAYVRGDFEERRQLTLKGLSVSRQLGNEFLMVYDLANLADMMVEQGELDQAGKYVEECLTIASQIGEKRMIANSLLIQAKINQQQGHLETVTELICKSLSVSYDIRDRTGILEAMWFLIANLQLQEARMQAALLWGASETIYSQPDFLSLPQQSWESLFAGRAQNAELQQARERGQKMNLDEVVNFILGELCN